MNLHIKRYGIGTPLVLFHGWGFDHQVWLPLIPWLERHYTLILVDLPGFGLTDLMDWVTFKNHLLECLPESFALAGWSLGGLYATRLAIEAPDSVSCLLNINSSPYFIEESSWSGINQNVLSQFYNNLCLDAPNTLNEFVALQLKGIECTMPLNKSPSLQGLESGLIILKQWDLRKELHRLKQPTCYMFGRLDPITPAKTMQIMQQRYPQFKYVLFNKAAHMPFLSHSQSFIQNLHEFIP